MTINEDNSAGFAFWLRFWCRVVAALQIVGGVCGIYLVVVAAVRGKLGVVLLLAFWPFAAAAWSGVLLALGRQGGLTASLLVQALQLIQIVVPGFTYTFGCGLMLVFGMEGPVKQPLIGFNYYYGPRFFLLFNSSSEAVPNVALTGLNLVAVLCIVCLLLERAAEKRRVPDTNQETADVPEPENAWPPAPKV